MIRRGAAALFLALVCAATIGAAPVTHAAEPLGCQAFADIPKPAVRAPTRALIVVWGEFHCASARTLSVKVCAVAFPGGAAQGEPRPIWCTVTRVKVAAGGKSFVQARPHGCKPGMRYRSYVSILGHGSDVGPFAYCRSLQAGVS